MANMLDAIIIIAGGRLQIPAVEEARKLKLKTIVTDGNKNAICSNLADQFYNDVDLWWIIAIANPDIIRRDSLSLKGGLDIRIPTNHHLIVQHFNAINK